MKMLVCCFNPSSLDNIHLGYMEAGCEVDTLFIGGAYENNTDLLVKDLSEKIEGFKPAVIYSYGWWDIGIRLESYLEVIKSKGIFHIFWAYDDPVCLENISMPMAVKSDLVFTTVEECIPEYRKRGIAAHLLMHGCYPPRHKRVVPEEDFKKEIVLLANNYDIYEDAIYREFRGQGVNHMVRPLVDDDYDIKVWGRWWNHWEREYILPGRYYGGVLPRGEEAKVYSSCKISLGLQTVGTSKTHLSVRSFEAMACGAFHLSQYSPALEEHFKKGVHLEWSRSQQETLEIVRYYLRKETKREEIALKGQREVYEKHTLLHRARSALDIIKAYT